MVNFTPASVVADITYGLGLLSSFGNKVDIVGIYSNGGGSTSGAPLNIPSTAGLAASFGNSSIINSILGLSSTTAAFGQMFVNARPLKATVRETSKVMEHPVETGSIISDHHIINPVEIDIPVIVTAQNYASTYTQIRQAFINATLLSVKTRTGTYQNMIIAEMPHEEESEMYNAIVIALRLRQVLIFTPGASNLQSGYQPLNAANNNTISSGLQAGVTLSGKLLTTATSIGSYAALARRL